jgi:hypothetical protein
MDPKPSAVDSNVLCRKALKCMLPRMSARHVRFWAASNARLGMVAWEEPDFPTGQHTGSILVMIENCCAAKNVTAENSAPANTELVHFALVVRKSESWSR